MISYSARKRVRIRGSRHAACAYDPGDSSEYILGYVPDGTDEWRVTWGRGLLNPLSLLKRWTRDGIVGRSSDLIEM